MQTLPPIRSLFALSLDASSAWRASRLSLQRILSRALPSRTLPGGHRKYGGEIPRSTGAWPRGVERPPLKARVGALKLASRVPFRAQDGTPLPCLLRSTGGISRTLFDRFYRTGSRYGFYGACSICMDVTNISARCPGAPRPPANTTAGGCRFSHTLLAAASYLPLPGVPAFDVPFRWIFALSCHKHLSRCSVLRRLARNAYLHLQRPFTR